MSGKKLEEKNRLELASQLASHVKNFIKENEIDENEVSQITCNIILNDGKYQCTNLLYYSQEEIRMVEDIIKTLCCENDINGGYNKFFDYVKKRNEHKNGDDSLWLYCYPISQVYDKFTKEDTFSKRELIKEMIIDALRAN